MSNLRRMLIAKAMSKDSTKMGEVFHDCGGNFPLSNGSITEWNQLVNKDDIYITSNATYTTNSDSSITIKYANNSSRFSFRGTEIDSGNYLFMFINQLSTNFDGYVNIEHSTRNASGAMFVCQINTQNGIKKSTSYISLRSGIKSGYNRILQFQFAYGDNELNIYPNKCGAIDLSKLLGDCVMPSTSIDNVLNYLGCDSTEDLNDLEYAVHIPLIVHNGNLHYALTKEVRDYASKFGVLDALNEYCCEHKDVIPYVNSWKYLIHSLGLGTGYTSWLKGDGVAYIETGYMPNANTGFRVVTRPLTYYTSAHTPLGSRGSAGGDNRFWINFTSGGTLSLGFKTAQTLEQPYTLDKDYDIDLRIKDNVACYVNGTRLEYGSVNPSSMNEMYLFASKESDGNAKYFYDGRTSIIQIAESQEVIKEYVPYYDKKTRTFGMLDLCALGNKYAFHTSAITTGVFTWILTNASGSDVTLTE